MSKRRIQITDLQKQEIEEKQEIRLLIRLHIFYLILLISGDIILFPVEYNSILIRTEINVPEIPKMNADNK